MNSLGLRTEVMLDCLEPLTLADPTAAKAIWDGWSDLPPPRVGRHPGDEEDDFDDDDDLDELEEEEDADLDDL